MFIPAKSNQKISLGKVNLKGKVGVVTTIQYLNSVKKLCKGSFIFCGQVIGCDFSNALKLKSNVDSYLYIGTGKFHPLGLAIAAKKDIYILNPISNHFSKLSNGEIEDYAKKRKGSIIKFLHAEKIGLLITLKQGQYTPKRYSSLKEKMKIIENLEKKYPKKKFFTFVFNTLRKEELENFNDIQCWVNLACPRIIDDYESIVNVSEI